MTLESQPHDLASDRFWAVCLPAGDQVLLDQAFARDRELRHDTALMFQGLLALDLRDVFIAALVAQLRARGHSRRPAQAVMPALERTLAAARARAQALDDTEWEPR
jgi:hypothetical protein